MSAGVIAGERALEIRQENLTTVFPLGRPLFVSMALMMPTPHQNVLVFHTERKKKTLIKAREGSEQSLNIVFVHSTEGSIKGEKKRNLELAAISNHTFLMFIPLFLN